MHHSLAGSYLSMCLCIVGTTALMLAVGERPQAVWGQPKILAAGMRIGVTSAKYLTGARIVRAFNTMNFRRLESNANRPGARLAIPIAGDDKEAISVAESLIRYAGFDPVLVGPLKSAGLFAQRGPLYGQDITAQEMVRHLKSLR
ncbi:MAG: hypothetical protein ACM3SP_18070 [Chloroflexota bacterium]